MEKREKTQEGKVQYRLMGWQSAHTTPSIEEKRSLTKKSCISRGKRKLDRRWHMKIHWASKEGSKKMRGS